MNKEYKYCKFCSKDKPLEEFCKSGSFIKNICKECNNTKQKKIYNNSKKADIYKQALNEIRKYANGAYEMAIYTKSVSLDEENIEDILHIIDKVLGDEK